MGTFSTCSFTCCEFSARCKRIERAYHNEREMENNLETFLTRITKQVAASRGVRRFTPNYKIVSRRRTFASLTILTNLCISFLLFITYCNLELLVKRSSSNVDLAIKTLDDIDKEM